MEKLKVEYIDTGELKPYENNAKIHTDAQIEQTVITIDSELAHWYKDIFDGIISFDRTFDDVKPYEC